MDIFKALGDWLGGGNKKKEQDKQAQAFQQQQAAKAASMPKVLNPAGQQQWMQKNAPSLAKPPTVAAPKPEAPRPFSIAPVLPQQTPQPKAPVVAQPIKTPATPSLSINDRAAETRAQINKVQTNNRQAAQTRLAAPTGTFGKSVGDQPMQALRGRSISQFVGDFNKSDSDTQRSLRQTLEKQRDFDSTSVSPEGRSMFKQSQDTLDYLDKLGQSKPTSLKGAISDVGKFGGDLAKGMITAAGAATQPLTAGLAASRSQQAYKSGQINQDQYNREIKNATDGTGGYYFRYGQKPDGTATLLQPSQNDDGSRRNLLDATLKQAQSFVNAGVDTGLTASGIANAPANVSRSLANSTGRNLIKNAAPALKEAAAYQGVDMANQAIQGNNPLDPTYLAQSVASNTLLPLGGYGVGAGARKVLDKASDSLTSRALSNPTLREQVIQPRVTTPKIEIPPRVQQQAIEYGVVTPATRSLSPNERVLTALNSDRQPQLPPELPSPQLRADNKGVAFKIDDEWAANRTPAQHNLANALDGDTPSEPISFGRLRDEQVQAANDIFRERGMPEIDNPELRVHPAVIDKLREKRVVNEGLSPEQIADIAHSAVNNRRSVVSDVTDKSRSVQLSTKKGDVQNNAFVGSFDGDGSLKSAYPTSSRRNLISDTPINDQSIRSASNSVEADRANMQLADSVMDTATTNNVAHNRGGVNRDADMLDTQPRVNEREDGSLIDTKGSEYESIGGNPQRLTEQPEIDPEAKRLRIKGKRAKSKESTIPVSTHETRRRSISVNTPKGKMTQYAAANTLDGSGKASYELIPLDSTKHTLKNGMVVDKNGKSVGSYLGIDEAGQQYAYIEGHPVNITGIMGDIDAWGNMNSAFQDMDRLIEKNAPDMNTARKVQEFTTVFKDQQEAVMKTDIAKHRIELAKLESKLSKELPKGITKKELSADLFRMMEGKSDMDQVRQKYGAEYTAKQIEPALKWARKQFDTILGDTNQVLERNGFEPIPRRDNYITHIQEDPNFWSKVGIGIQDITSLGKSISSDVNPGTTRAGIPDEIVGLTANTNARRKWNPFAKERKGDAAKQDFFGAIDGYYEPMMFNKYMTPAASRVRVVERAFRTFDKAKQLQLEELAKIVGIDEAKKQQKFNPKTNKNYEAGLTSPLISAWQEYGNMLAGKTNALDRIILDKGGKAGSKTMQASTKLQGITGASAIPGSTTAALAQVLSIPQTVARDSAKSVLKASRDMLGFGAEVGSKTDPMRQSSFMRARYTDATTKRKTLLQNYTSKASIPMEAIERFTGELSWRSSYHEALKKGYSGTRAIKEADINTKKTLAGRGVGDRPLAMNSKALGAVTQFGLEVNNMRIQFWNDFTPVQKVKFMVAATALNTVYGAVTGSTQLPDYIQATLDSYSDINDSSDDSKDTIVDDGLQFGQRMVGETSKFIPGSSAIASMLMDDTTKEQVFGKNGDVSRYGSMALTKPIKAAVDAVGGISGAMLASGENAEKTRGDSLKQARDAAISVAPTGSQVKRSINGIEAMQQGYTTKGGGKVQNTLDQNNPMNWFQAALFGKYSLPGQQDAMNKNVGLGDKQSEVYKKLADQSKAAADDYFSKVVSSRKSGDKKGTLTDVGNNTASAMDSLTAQELQAKKDINLADGTWKEENGYVVNKQGEIQRSFYKELAKSSDKKNEATYAAYLKGYNLEDGTKYAKDKDFTTGSQNLDSLLKANAAVSGKTSLASKAVSLMSDSKKYADMPEWVKDRFYKDAGYSKEQVEYAAIADTKMQVRLDNLYRPIAEKGDKTALIKALSDGRREGIKDKKVWAQDSLITALQKEGHLTKDEAKYLKALKLDWEHKETKESSDKKSTASKGGRSGGKKRSKGGKASASGGYTSADISKFVNNSGTGYDTSIQKILSSIKSKGGSGNSTISVKKPNMRSLSTKSSSLSRSKGKLFKTKIG